MKHVMWQKIKPYLPSTRFQIGIGVVVGAAILWFGGSALIDVISLERTRNAQEENIEARIADELTPKEQEKFRKDTDGDGLPDWEELLWGTNPDEVDTDGDGIDDADEIALIRENEAPVTAARDFSKVTNIGGELYRLLLALQSRGVTGEDATRQATYAYFDFANQKINRDLPTRDDLVVVPLTTASAQQYIDKMDVYIRNNNNDTMKKMPEGVQEANDLLAQEQGVIVETPILDELHDHFKSMHEEALDIAVPEPLVPIHLKITKQTLRLQRVFDGLRNGQEDYAYANGALLNLFDPMYKLHNAYWELLGAYQGI